MTSSTCLDSAFVFKFLYPFDHYFEHAPMKLIIPMNVPSPESSASLGDKLRRYLVGTLRGLSMLCSTSCSRLDWSREYDLLLRSLCIYDVWSLLSLANDLKEVLLGRQPELSSFRIKKGCQIRLRTKGTSSTTNQGRESLTSLSSRRHASVFPRFIFLPFYLFTILCLVLYWGQYRV